MEPRKTSSPELILWNQNLSERLDLNVDSPEWSKRSFILSGNSWPVGSEPIAMAYSGHQFGRFNAHLGDGRALLLGEHTDNKNNKWDIHLKGSGQTQFSRRGDGRSALGPSLREYIISEALYHLNIPTTRTLAVCRTGDWVTRDSQQPGGVSCRIAKSHIRIGTFEHFAARHDFENLKRLFTYTIKRHYRDQIDPEGTGAILTFLKTVAEKQAALIAKWMSVGFIHGVMNTDNILISGETIDFGPCAFLDYFDPQKVFSSIDHNGRYAFDQQPKVIQWNLAVLAECLLTLVDTDEKVKALEQAQDIIASVDSVFRTHYDTLLSHKLGFKEASSDTSDIIQNFLKGLYQSKMDYTASFRVLTDSLLNSKAQHSSINENNSDIFSNYFKKYDHEFWTRWHADWKKYLEKNGLEFDDAFQRMAQNNPIYIPRNYLVEESLSAAVENNDITKIKDLLEVLKSPYHYKDGYDRYQKGPDHIDDGYRTFCGT